jgi:hypothetical protein
MEQPLMLAARYIAVINASGFTYLSPKKGYHAVRLYHDQPGLNVRLEHVWGGPAVTQCDNFDSGANQAAPIIVPEDAALRLQNLTGTTLTGYALWTAIGDGETPPAWSFHNLVDGGAGAPGAWFDVTPDGYAPAGRPWVQALTWRGVPLDMRLVSSDMATVYAQWSQDWDTRPFPHPDGLRLQARHPGGGTSNRRLLVAYCSVDPSKGGLA